MFSKIIIRDVFEKRFVGGICDCRVTLHVLWDTLYLRESSPPRDLPQKILVHMKGLGSPVKMLCQLASIEGSGCPAWCLGIFCCAHVTSVSRLRLRPSCPGSLGGLGKRSARNWALYAPAVVRVGPATWRPRIVKGIWRGWPLKRHVNADFFKSVRRGEVSTV